jgi:hypothetical protein
MFLWRLVLTRRTTAGTRERWRLPIIIPFTVEMLESYLLDFSYIYLQSIQMVGFILLYGVRIGNVSHLKRTTVLICNISMTAITDKLSILL